MSFSVFTKPRIWRIYAKSAAAMLVKAEAVGFKFRAKLLSHPFLKFFRQCYFHTILRAAIDAADHCFAGQADRAVTACAAPGGKSTELAARLHGEGVLVSNDISNSRAKALLKNLELFGVKNAVVVSESPAKLAGRFESYFDKILVDAPCSGEGMFRKSHVQDAVARLHRKQACRCHSAGLLKIIQACKIIGMLCRLQSVRIEKTVFNPRDRLQGRIWISWNGSARSLT